MDKNNDKKKESIDEILSDLNGLLNKMPSILDGIKMPDIKPVEFSGRQPSEQQEKPRPAPEKKAEPEPAPAPEPASPQFDKTVVLSPFAGLPEGAAAPELAPADAAAREPEGEKLVPQSLGDFMFGEGAEQPAAQEQQPDGIKISSTPLDPPEPKTRPESGEGPTLSISELNPPPETEKKPEPEDNLAEASLEVPVPAEEKLTLLPTDDFSLEAPAPESSLGFPTAGFGPKSVDDSAIPDIDALMNLPEMTAEAGEERGQAPAGQPAETTAPEADPSVDELAEFEKQLAAAAPGGSMDLNSPKEENPELTPGQGEIPAQEQPSGLPASDETLRLEPAPEAAPQEEAVPEGLFAEIPAAAAEGTLRLEPEAVQAAINEPAAELSIEPQAVVEPAAELSVEPQAVVEPAAELSIEPQAAVEPAPELSVGTSPEPVLSVPEAPASGGIELSVSPAAESTLQMRPADGPLSAAPSLSADMTQPGLSLEPRVSVATDSDDSEKTMLAAPPPSAEADGDKTMVFDVSSSSPGTTSRAKAGDLAGLSQSEPPPGLPEERIRSLYFLYAPEDAALCASLLMELDTVCLRSQTSPMFIKRTGVKVFEQDMNPNFVAQTVNDSGAKGLICVGAVPQDKVYEIENVFASSGVYFKHFDSTSFSHSAVLDLLLELILR